MLSSRRGGFVYLDHRSKAPVALLGFSTYLIAVSVTRNGPFWGS